ncbi:hypothetical protein B5V01_19420 [Mesorhizobium erdmanii]|uniref:DUF4034 domain-containing protein n=3 Tax=Phyllobacteriaceae TaxID=69277 RepID=A0A3M9X5Y9_9HYPH|nr:hypothetical protein DNR46_22110 [Mesorhizobium japonicum]RXT44004.1 hypothetical protein B5V01_19420 [Mesorhizobium erdmanii]
MLMRIIQVVLILLSFLFMTNANADEIEDREGIRGTVRVAFLDGNFKKLDAIAEEYRDSKARTASGLWKLTTFYSTFDILAWYPTYGEQSLDRFEQQAKKWIDEAPESKSAYIAYAILLYRHAFFVRGNGYASSVAPENWPVFRKYLNEAHRQLAASKAFASSDPHWYATMLNVATGEYWPEPEFDALLDEAAGREPYYYEIYFAAIIRKAPQWGGSLDDVAELIDHAVQLTKPQDGVGFYARGYWYAMDQYLGRKMFRDSQTYWAKIKAGFEDLVKQYPDEWNLNAYARFACISLDAEATCYRLRTTTQAPPTLCNFWQMTLAAARSSIPILTA